MTAAGRGAPLNSLNPAVKLIVFVSVIQTVSVISDTSQFIFFTLIYAGAVSLSDIGPGQIFRKAKPFFLILITTFLINLFFGSGAELSLVLTLRFFLIILFSILLTTTTDPAALISVLMWPFRGTHGQNLRLVLMVAMEFVPVFAAQAKETAADIKKMPEYSGGAYRALFRPELYLRPLIEGIARQSKQTAAHVTEGRYSAVPIPRPAAAEILLAASAAVCAVLYAL